MYGRWWFAFAVLLTACEAHIGTTSSSGRSGAAARNRGESARASVGSRAGMSGKQCRPGERMDESERREIAQTWQRIERVERADVGQSTTNAAFACTLAHGIATECPLWDSRASEVEQNVCAIALREDLEQARAKFGAFIEEGGLAVPPVLGKPDAETWPRNNPARGVAVSLKRLQASKPSSAKHRALLERAEQFRADVEDVSLASRKAARLGDSCENVEALEALAAKTASPVAGRFLEREAEKRRKEQSEKLRSATEQRIRKGYRFGEMDDPADAKRDAAELRSNLEELACFDADAADALQEPAAAWIASVEREADEEIACRNTPACIKRRRAEGLIGAICWKLERKREAQGAIAEMKAYGARYGTVNLREIHRRVEEIRSLDGRIEDEKREYRSVVGKAFNAGSCPKD